MRRRAPARQSRQAAAAPADVAPPGPPHPGIGPLLQRADALALLAARDAGDATWTGSLDLGRGQGTATLAADHWTWDGVRYPYPQALKDRAVHHFDGEAFAPLSARGHALVKLVPTPWGAPTFEIDGIKMLPTARVSPWADAAAKVALVRPAGAAVLDCCGGLGYFAAHVLAGGAARLLSFEKSDEVLWLRRHNPWSPWPEAPEHGGRLDLRHDDVAVAIASLADASFDAVLHDPPRFGIAGELYSQAFYDQLARVLARGGRLFHYTGSPNRLTSGRDVAREVQRRLQRAGFAAEPALDGVFARR